MTPEQEAIIIQNRKRIQREKARTPEYKAKIESYRLANRVKISDTAKKKNETLRIKVVEFFGGRCMNPNCLVPNGCSDIRCLQIDYIQACG